MCGIAGFSLTHDADLPVRKLAKELLTQIVSRGRDATGIAWTAPGTGEIRVRKAPVAAWRFVNPDPAWSLDALSQLPEDARTVILHTRAATQGDPADHVNNHPIVSGSTVGVHNGVIYNDDQLFDYLGSRRQGEVDSEAAFALIDRLAYPDQALRLIEGGWALAWLDANQKDVLHLVRGSSSPVKVRGTSDGSFIFASEDRHVDAALKAVGVQEAAWGLSLGEGDYMRVHHGQVASYTALPELPKVTAAATGLPALRAAERARALAVIAADASYVPTSVESKTVPAEA